MNNSKQDFDKYDDYRGYMNGFLQVSIEKHKKIEKRWELYDLLSKTTKVFPLEKLITFIILILGLLYEIVLVLETLQTRDILGVLSILVCPYMVFVIIAMINVFIFNWCYKKFHLDKETKNEIYELTSGDRGKYTGGGYYIFMIIEFLSVYILKLKFLRKLSNGKSYIDLQRVIISHDDTGFVRKDNKKRNLGMLDDLKDIDGNLIYEASKGAFYLGKIGKYHFYLPMWLIR